MSALILFILSAHVSSCWAEVKELKWISEKDRPKADLSGDFKSPDGTTLSLRDPKSKVVFLNFWATWCEPCKEEMPAMAKLYAQFRDEGLQMIAVTTSSRGDVQKYLAKQGFDFTIALDPKDSLGTRFKTELVPTTIILDSNRRVALRYGGAYPWDSPAAVNGLRALLAGETAPSVPVSTEAPPVAQESETLNGTWAGDWGPSAADRNTVSVDLKLDGGTVTGTVHSLNPEKPDVAIRKGTFDSRKGVLRLEAEVPNPKGGKWRPLHYMITGKVENGSISGSWNHADKKGDFKLSKK